MKWLIKPTLLEQNKIQSVIRMLEISDIPYDIVHTLDGVMYNSDKEVYELDLSQQHFVCGSYQLAKAFHKLQPSATFLLDNYNFKDWYKIFGKENMLNPEVQFTNTKNINWINEEMFVRPLEDTKSFNGGIYNSNSILPDVQCIVAPLKQIQKEFRFFVLNGEIIGESQYKMNGELFPSSIIDNQAKEFAKTMIQKFPFPGYVIDIALTNNQCNIVELNCFNASGFYVINLYKFIEKITTYYNLYKK